MVGDSKNKTILLLTVIFLCTVEVLIGQSAKDKADQAFTLFKYQEAIELYISYLDKNKDSEASTKLAEAYFLTSNYDKCELILKQVV